MSEISLSGYKSYGETPVTSGDYTNSTSLSYQSEIVSVPDTEEMDFGSYTSNTQDGSSDATSGLSYQSYTEQSNVSGTNGSETSFSSTDTTFSIDESIDNNSDVQTDTSSTQSQTDLNLTEMDNSSSSSTTANSSSSASSQNGGMNFSGAQNSSNSGGTSSQGSSSSMGGTSSSNGNSASSSTATGSSGIKGTTSSSSSQGVSGMGSTSSTSSMSSKGTTSGSSMSGSFSKQSTGNGLGSSTGQSSLFSSNSDARTSDITLGVGQSTVYSTSSSDISKSAAVDVDLSIEEIKSLDEQREEISAEIDECEEAFKETSLTYKEYCNLYNDISQQYDAYENYISGNTDSYINLPLPEMNLYDLVGTPKEDGSLYTTEDVNLMIQEIVNQLSEYGFSIDNLPKNSDGLYDIDTLFNWVNGSSDFSDAYYSNIFSAYKDAFVDYKNYLEGEVSYYSQVLNYTGQYIELKYNEYYETYMSEEDFGNFEIPSPSDFLTVHNVTHQHNNVTTYSLNDNSESGKLAYSLSCYMNNSEIQASGAQYYTDRLAYMTEDQLEILEYLCCTEGYESGLTYFESIEEELTRQMGYAAAEEWIEKYIENSGYLKNENGVYVIDAVDWFALVGKGFGDGVETFFAGIENLFNADGELSVSDYETQYLLNYIAESCGDKNGLKNFITGSYEISSSIGNMAPAIAISVATGGLGVSSAVSGALSSAAFGASAAGNAREQGLQSGMNNMQAWIYGVLSGSSEVFLERFLGGIPGLSNLNGFASLGGIKGYFSRMLGEAVEEGLQEILDPIFSCAVTGNLENLEIDWAAVGKSSLYGAITAGLMNINTLVNTNEMTYQIDGVEYHLPIKGENSFESIAKSSLEEGLTIQEFQAKIIEISLYNNSKIDSVVNNNENVNAQASSKTLESVISEANYYGSKGNFIVVDPNSLSEELTTETLSQFVYPDITRIKLEDGSTITISEYVNVLNQNVNNAIINANNSGENFVVINCKNLGRSLTFEEILQITNSNTEILMENGTKIFVKDIINIKNSINSCSNITVEYLNEILNCLNVNEQVSFYNSILSQMLNGTKIDSKIYEVFFTSSVFDARSNFSYEFMNNWLNDNCPDICETILNSYTNAQTFTARSDMSALHSYCDHTFHHVLSVAFLTLNSSNVINTSLKIKENTNYADVSEYTNTIFLTGLCHDLGMAAGTDFVNGVNSYIDSKTNTPKSNSLKEDANDIRTNHALGSALKILEMRDSLTSSGFNPDLMAIMAFSHTKSNSGLLNLSNLSDWSLAIDRISNAVETVNEVNNLGIKFDYSQFGTIGETVGKTSIQKTDGGKKSIEYKQFNFIDNWNSIFNTLTTALRVGDAYVSKAKIKLETPIKWNAVEIDSNGNKVIVTHETSTLVLTQAGVFMAFDESVKNTQKFDCCSEFENLDSAFIYLTIDENGNYVPWNVSGKNDGYSISNDGIIDFGENTDYFMSSNTGQFLAGESNTSYRFDVGENGELISTYIVENSGVAPINTYDKGINERIGEILPSTGIERIIVIENINEDVFYDEIKQSLWEKVCDKVKLYINGEEINYE